MFGLQALQNDSFETNPDHQVSNLSAGEQDAKEFFLSEGIKQPTISVTYNRAVF
jgi:hypothetical protein